MFAALLLALAAVLAVVALVTDHDPLLVAAVALGSCALGLAVGAWIA
jgi:hypothetical protein